MRKRLLLVAILLLFIINGVYAVEKRPMTVDDGLNMVRVGNAVMSPDGKWVLFSKSELDWSKNKRKVTYYMIPAEGGEEFQYIGEAGGKSFRFSPDGKYLAFLRKKDKKSQIFVMRTSGGEAVQLTKHKTSIISFKWSPDSTKIFFLAPDARTKEEEEKYKAGYDALFVDEGPNGQVEGHWQNLWMEDLKSKKERKITDEKIIIKDFDISSDGMKIIFTARYENRRNQEYLSEIYLFNLEKKEKIRLTENKAPERYLQWAPNGKFFAYIAPDDKKWELRQNKIWVMNPETKEYRLISSKFNGQIRNYVWTPDSKYILFTGLVRTNSNLYKINVLTGEVIQLTHVKGSLFASSFSKDRRKMVYLFSDFDTPPDLYVSSTEKFEPIRLTNANPWIEKEILLAKAEVIRWKSKDGLEIEGILYLPPNYNGKKKLPLILHVHGGPAGVFTNSFSYRYHVWAGLGYASLCPNVRGSTGYGDEFLRGNMYDIGGGDYWDLMTGVDYVIKMGYVDPERMGIRGWSYGGILGAWTITQTNRFKAASLGALVALWISEYGAGFNYDVRLWYIGGTPWDNSEGYTKRSVFTYVKTGMNEEELVKTIPPFDGIIVRSATKVTSRVIDAAENLKIIVRAGIGLDNIDLEAAEKKGIKVTNTPAATTISVAELTMGLMLSAVRNIAQANMSMKNHKWEKKLFMGTELYEKTLGIVGFGRIGKEVARRALAFGMKILVYDIIKIETDLDVKQVSFEELLSNSDIITLHIPLTEDTRHIISEKEFNLMKDGVILINIARGGVVDEKALLNALNSGKVKTAAIDVWEKEPTDNFELVDHPNVIALPHLGASAKEGQARAGLEAVKILKENLL